MLSPRTEGLLKLHMTVYTVWGAAGKGDGWGRTGWGSYSQDLVTLFKALLCGRAVIQNACHEYPHVVAPGQAETHTLPLPKLHQLHTGPGRQSRGHHISTTECSSSTIRHDTCHFYPKHLSEAENNTSNTIE